MLISKKKYAELKNFVYRYSILDLVNGDNKAQKAMALELEKYADPKLTDIIMNTFTFPFDLELCKFLMENSLSNETLLHASNIFNISFDLVMAKSKEYTEFRFVDSINNQNIDLNLVNQLSNIYSETLTIKNKQEK